MEEAEKKNEGKYYKNIGKKEERKERKRGREREREN